MTRDRTHELKIFANAHHKTAQAGDLILHLWFVGETTMRLDLEIALDRPDVGYVDLIDCRKHTTRRMYSNQGGGDADERKRKRKYLNDLVKRRSRTRYLRSRTRSGLKYGRGLRYWRR